MAVSLSGYSGTREARAGPPRASIYIQVGNSTWHGRRALAPLPEPGLLSHHVGDKGTGHSHRPPRRAPPEPSVPNRVPLCRSAPTHFCRLGGIQNPPEIGPSRAQPLNLPRKALLLPKADEHPPSTPLNQSHPSVLGVQDLARLRGDPLGTHPAPLIPRHHPVPQFLHLSVEDPGRLSRAPREPMRCWRRG